jgi:LacI family transcriptional regulator
VLKKDEILRFTKELVMPVTMREVAEKAGVSIKTVSRVVNREEDIAAATRKRVLAVIDELGYRPSRVARALVTQSSSTIGLVVGDIGNPFFPEVAQGVLNTAQAREYHVFLGSTNGDVSQELSILHSLADHGVAGIIIHPTYASSENLTAFLADFQPVVVINHPFAAPGVSQIMVDTQQGAQLAVDHLVGLGHREIAMLSGVADPVQTAVRRIVGFRAAMARHDLPVASGRLVPIAEPTVEQGEQATCQLLREQPEVSAISAYNDLLAVGALRACQALGRRVPDDCAVVGFDDIHLAGQVTPALTTVRFDKYGLGQQAVARLFEMLAAPTQSFPPFYSAVELVVRQST